MLKNPHDEMSSAEFSGLRSFLQASGFGPAQVAMAIGVSVAERSRAQLVAYLKSYLRNLKRKEAKP